MADTITVTYKVNEDGSLSKIAKGADKAAKATDKVSKASARHNKQQKGVAGSTSNTTKGFSKMTTGMTTGLVPAYATLAANVFALSAAFGLLSRNDAIAKLNEGLELTGLAAGKNLGMLSRKLQEVTGHAISAEESMRAVAIGTSAGFSDEQLVGLTQVAKGAALALGRNMPDAIDRLIRGAAKLEPEILDELGIMVRLDDATKNYAKSVGKTVGQLTQFERRMAFTNAVIDQGQQKFAAIAAEMEASGYSKLSASFSDLTKQGIELLNGALKPIINFLAGNTAALTTVMLAFGASISSTLLSSLGEMAESSAEAGKQAANLSKHTVIGIKSQKHMGKAFNKSADAMKDANLSAEDYSMHLNKMQQSSKLTVNMMGKENKLRKLAVRDRNHLTKAVHLAALAEHKDGAAKALNMIQTHGLSAAYAEHRMVLAANSATTKAATIGQDLQTQATIRARSAMFALGASAKFAGAAMITAMPYLMGIMAVASLVGPLLKSLFGEKEDKLSKQIELNTERFEKFTDVVAKYNITVKHAATASEAWHNTVKPLAGLFEQINTAMTETNLAAETDRILAYAAATRKVAEAEETRVGIGEFAGVAKSVAQTKAQLELTNALVISDKDLLTMREQSTLGLATLIASMKQMQEGLGKNEKGNKVTADAQDVLTNSHKEATAILEALIKNTDMSAEVTEASQAALQKLADKLKVGLKAYEDFNEVVLQAKEQSATPTFGVMADELDTLTESVALLTAIDATTGLKLTTEAAEQQAKHLVDAYGIVKDEITEVETIIQNGIEAMVPTGVVRMETNVEAVENHLLQVQRLNQGYKDLAIEQSTTASLAKVMGDDADYLYESVFENAKESLRLSKLQYELIKKGGEDSYQQSLKVLEVERELLAIVSKRMEVLASRAEDSGMGAGASAAIAGVGKTAALEAGGVGEGEMFATDAGKEEALAAQATQNARDSLAGVAEDIAKMGPEGALMSSAISGAMNMSTAFSTAFEVMNTDSASTSDKIQAGLGAVGATLGALSSMQKAASADKIRAIDGEIAAEKARDGKSAGSVAKLAALEKKKEQAKRKAFEQDKKMKMAQTVISTAQGVTAMLGAAPPPFNFALAGMVAAMGVKQLAMISGTSFQGGGTGGGAGAAPTTISAGSRKNSVDFAKTQSSSGELGYMRGESGIGGAENFRPAFSGYKHRAGGGYVVGEQGPELFMPETPGTIIPSGQGAGGSTNVNFSIQAVDAEGVEDLLVKQRGNIIGMIREAANSYGQDFMEGIDTSIYTPSSAGATKY